MKTFRITFEHYHYIDILAASFSRKGPTHVRFVDAAGDVVAEYYDGEILSVDELPD